MPQAKKVQVMERQKANQSSSTPPAKVEEATPASTLQCPKGVVARKTPWIVQWRSTWQNDTISRSAEHFLVGFWFGLLDTWHHLALPGNGTLVGVLGWLYTLPPAKQGGLWNEPGRQHSVSQQQCSLLTLSHSSNARSVTLFSV